MIVPVVNRNRREAMNLRWVLPLLIVPFLVACGSEGGQDSSSGDDERATASRSSSGDRGGDGSKWRVDYSGDLSGQVSGDYLTVSGIGDRIMVVGMAMAEDLSGPADHNIQATIMDYGEGPRTSLKLELADGTQCSDVTRQDPEQSAVDIIDPEPDTLRAEIRGTLHCGENKDQRIEFTAMLNADP